MTLSDRQLAIRERIRAERQAAEAARIVAEKEATRIYGWTAVRNLGIDRMLESGPFLLSEKTRIVAAVVPYSLWCQVQWFVARVIERNGELAVK